MEIKGMEIKGVIHYSPGRFLPIFHSPRFLLLVAIAGLT